MEEEFYITEEPKSTMCGATAFGLFIVFLFVTAAIFCN